MSMFSIFYAGDTATIEAAIEDGQLDFANDSAVKMEDLFGGLFSDDFLVLTKGGSASFWTLETGNLMADEEAHRIQDQEHGLYRVPDEECDKLLALREGQLSEFSKQRNAREAQEWAQDRRSYTIWRSREYWVITAGIAGGLLGAYILDVREPVIPVLLAGWLACAVAYGVCVSRRRRLREKLRPPDEPVDWVTPLHDLQSFLSDARRRGVPVYYYWSL